MVPIHDSDVSEQRWSKSEWENYELWEKVEQRLKRQKRRWILGTVIAVVFFSAIPTVMERWPKWVTRSAARHLAQEINRMKREASIERASYRLRFVDKAKFEYVIEKVKDCHAPGGDLVRSFSGEKDTQVGDYALILPTVGRDLGIPGLIQSYCYDYLEGSVVPDVPSNAVSAFGIISVNDLTARRLDRVSLLLFSGPSTDVSFD